MMSQTSPALPGAMAGTPPGPGSSPVAAPGSGAGNKANALSKLKGIFPLLYQIQSALPPGSDEWTHVQDMIKSGGKVVGKMQDESTVPSAIQQMMLAAKQGGPLKSAPPVGIQPANANIAPKEEPEPV